MLRGLLKAGAGFAVSVPGGAVLGVVAVALSLGGAPTCKEPASGKSEHLA